MLSSRRTCAFGLPDDTEDLDNLVSVAVGHALRVATAPMLDTALPAELAGLLRRIERQERDAQARHRARRRATPRDPVHADASRLQPFDRRIEVPAATKAVTAL
jgi:hypothetical protein